MPPLLAKLSLLGRDIKLAHSVFALPFALLAAFWSAHFRHDPLHVGEIALILWCMFFARTYAMLANRYVDRHLDAGNPRTAGRALPAGKLQPREVRLAIFICALALLAGAAAFEAWYANWWPLAASPVVLIWLGFYGYAKRYTLAAHFILGVALAISPVAAALAIAPASLAQVTVWLLAGFVALWVGGFDVIYAMQDIDVDKESGLHSIPARLGPAFALVAAKITHLLALLLLVLCFRFTPAFFGAQYRLFSWAIVTTAVLLIVEHRAAARGRFSMAFFTFNGVISLLLAAAAIADLLMAGRP
jgi:4-hydroxybenzoate polyprenyltransferase